MPSSSHTPQTDAHALVRKARVSAEVVDPEKLNIAIRATSLVALLSAIAGLTWSAGATYGRLASAEAAIAETVPRVDALRMEQAKQEMINVHSVRQADQTLRSLERIENEIKAMRAERAGQ